MTDPRIMMPGHIHESNLIAGESDPTRDRQGAVCWLELCRYKTLTVDAIKECQRATTVWQGLPDRYRGQYRDVSVKYGCDPELIQRRMENWLFDMLQWKKCDPKEMHILFEKIHPFFDGNGRVGRLLFWWHQRRRGIQPTIIVDAHKEWDYYYWWK